MPKMRDSNCEEGRPVGAGRMGAAATRQGRGEREGPGVRRLPQRFRRQGGPVPFDSVSLHPKPAAATPYRTFEHVTDVRLTSQLLYVHSFALECERGIACNHERWS